MFEYNTLKVWAKDIGPFLDADVKPVYRVKVEGKKRKLLYGYWGCYQIHYHDSRMAAERSMLERCGFTKVELVRMKC